MRSTMKVRDVMTAPALCCRPEDSDDRAAQLLWENDCGVLPVVDGDGRAVGMVTDRDLCMAAYTRGRGLADLSVAEAMSREVFGCEEDDSIEDALQVMRQHGVRRLPVLDEDARIVGLLSMNDLVRAVTRDARGREAALLATALLGALGEVCRPRAASNAELVPTKATGARRRRRAPKALTRDEASRSPIDSEHRRETS